MNPFSDAPSTLWELVEQVIRFPELTRNFSLWCDLALAPGEPFQPPLPARLQMIKLDGRYIGVNHRLVGQEWMPC